MRARALGPALGLAAALAACTSPEATRMRAGGPGGDTGNRSPVVEMHEGSQPYWRTPRRIAGEVAESTGLDRPRRRVAPAASPR